MKRLHVAALLALLFGPSYGQAACVTAFGNQNAGFFYGPGVSWMIGSKYTLASPAFITEVGAKISSNPSTSFRIGVYTESGSNKPGTLLVETGALAGGPTGTQTFSLAQTYLPAGDYWIAVMADAGITFDAATGGLGTYRNTSTPYDVMPASGPATWSFHSGNQPAIWVNDCISDTYSPTITSTFSSTRTVTSTRTDTPVLSPTPTATVTPSATPDPCTLAFGISAYDYGNSTSNVFYASPYTPATNVTISQLGTEAFNAVGAVRLGLYAADGPAGDPGTLLAQTSEHSGAAGVLRLSIPETALTGGSTYWLAYVGGSGRRIAGNTAVGSYRFASFTYGALPASAPGTLSSGSGTFVLNAWACPASGSPTETYTLSPTRTPSPSPTATPSATISATATATPGCGIQGDVSFTAQSGSSTWRLEAAPILLAGSAQINAVLLPLSGTVSGDLIAAVYQDAGGTPGALLARSAQQASAYGLNTLTLSAQVNAGTVWLAIWRNNGQSVFYRSGAGVPMTAQVYDGILPPLWATNQFFPSLELVIGADLCPDGPFTVTSTRTLSPTHTVTLTPTPEATPACYAMGGYSQASENSLGDTITLGQYTLAAPATIDVLGLFARATGPSQVRLAVYSDNAGVPDALLAESALINVPTTAQQTSFTASIAPQALGAGTYWLGLIHSGPLVWGRSGTGSLRHVGQAFGAFPANVGATSFAPSSPPSVWASACAYTPTVTVTPTSTRSSTPTPSATFTPGACSAMGEVAVQGTNGGYWGAVNAQRHLAPSNHEMVAINIYNGNSAAVNVRVAVYSDNAGEPLTLLAQSASVAAVSGWNRLALPALTLSGGSAYWLAWQMSSTSFYPRYGGTGTGRYFTQAYGAFPGAFAGSPNSFVASFSVYAEVCDPAQYTATPTTTPTASATPTATPPACSSAGFQSRFTSAMPCPM